MDYQTYINSSEWASLRAVRLDFDAHKCRTCGESENLEVHHVYRGPPDFLYPAKLGEETLADIITLCKFCHEAITDSVRRRRSKTHPPLAIVKETSLQLREVKPSNHPQLKGVGKKDEAYIQNQRSSASVDAQCPTLRSVKRMD